MQWHYKPSPSLRQPLIEQLRTFPREPDMTIYGLRSAAALVTRACLRLYHRFTIRGRENLPLDRSFVLVANHSSHLDTLALLSALPLHKLHQAFPAAAQDYFFVDIPRLAVSAILVNAVPFARDGRNRRSLAMCQALLDNPGNILIIYPEGTRTTTGQVGHFRPGIGVLLAGRQIPAVPCAIRGAYQAWPKGHRIPRPARLTLTIGRPQTFADYPADKHGYEAIATNLENAVKELFA
jgi:1-acyl-sn-glycerol-3-phosphate acyltransferase